MYGLYGLRAAVCTVCTGCVLRFVRFALQILYAATRDVCTFCTACVLPRSCRLYYPRASHTISAQRIWLECARSCLTAHVCWQSTFSRMQPKPSPTAGCICATDKCMECPLLIGTGMPSNKVCIHVSASLVVLCVWLFGCCVCVYLVVVC